MPSAQPKHPHAARVAGIALLVLGGACAWLFTVYSNSTLARFGFPHAWAGAPILLGAVFLGITGGFLLAQRGFSLGALIIAGVAAAVVSAGAQAYLLNSLTSVTLSSAVYVPKEKQREFNERVQGILTAERLTAFADGLAAACRPRQVLDFSTLSVSNDCLDPDMAWMTTTLTFEYSPYLHGNESGIRGLIVSYVHVVTHIHAEKFGPPGRWIETPYFAATFLRGTWSGEASTAGELAETVGEFLHPLDGMERSKANREAVVWLRDHEPDPPVKQFFTDLLNEFDGLTKDRGK